MSYPMPYAAEERDLATLADLVELAGSAALVQDIAAAIALEQGRAPLVKEVVDRIFELRREAADDAFGGEAFEIVDPLLAAV